MTNLEEKTINHFVQKLDFHQICSKLFSYFRSNVAAILKFGVKVFRTKLIQSIVFRSKICYLLVRSKVLWSKEVRSNLVRGGAVVSTKYHQLDPHFITLLRRKGPISCECAGESFTVIIQLTNHFARVCARDAIPDVLLLCVQGEKDASVRISCE